MKGHSNNKYNGKVDELARRALEDNARVPISGDSWYSIPYFGKDELDTVIQLIQEENPGITLEKNNHADRVIFKLALSADHLTITHFHAANKKLLVQGRNSMLFQIFTTYINELIGVKETQVFANAYRKAIDMTKVNGEVDGICPVFPVDYPKGIIRLIKQSVINLNYFSESEDYCQYVFLALKALEGHMKYLLVKAGCPVTKNGFGMFEKNSTSNLYYLPDTIISDALLRKKLEKYYNYYNASRHTIFHFGDLIGPTDTTRFIDTKSEFDEHIKRCLDYICEA